MEQPKFRKADEYQKQIMSSVVAYIEYRIGQDDRSEGIKLQLASFGVKVNENLRRDTTHVIFREGRYSTYQKAKMWNIPLVSLLWVEACMERRIKCDHREFPIRDLEKYEEPEVYGKIKRCKFIQPNSEDKKRYKRDTPKD